jgi:hypothetical protein
VNCDGVLDKPGDLDHDFVSDNKDNCPTVPNLNQNDNDNDGIGDACDPDDDNDGVPDVSDDCPKNPDPTQADINHNNIGDACDPFVYLDSDHDGWFDWQDDCPNDPDTFQNDDDNDGIGDACDKCPNDADTVVSYGVIHLPDGSTKIFAIQPDADHDGIPDACDRSNDLGGTILFDGSLFSTSKGAKPDRLGHTVTLTGQPGTELSFPIALCNGACREAPVRPGIRFDLTNLDSQIVVVIRDERGHEVVHKQGAPGRRVIRFEPRGGRRYTMSFAFGPRFRGETKFQLAESAYRAKKMTAPRVRPQS